MWEYCHWIVCDLCKVIECHVHQCDPRTSRHVNLKHTPKMTCRMRLNQQPVFSLLAGTVLLEVENPSAHLEKERPVRAGNKSPLAQASSPSSSPLCCLCGAVSLLAFLSEKRLCSGWQSWVSAIEDLIRQSERGMVARFPLSEYGWLREQGSGGLWNGWQSGGRTALGATTVLNCQHPEHL